MTRKRGSTTTTATMTKTTEKKKSARAKGAKASKPAKFSALDAAAKVLGERKCPMNCKELIDEMAAKNYWNSPGGKTPANTLYSAILREIGTKKAEARFKKADRGQFALA